MEVGGGSTSGKISAQIAELQTQLAEAQSHLNHLENQIDIARDAGDDDRVRRLYIAITNCTETITSLTNQIEDLQRRLNNWNSIYGGGGK